MQLHICTNIKINHQLIYVLETGFSHNLGKFMCQFCLPYIGFFSCMGNSLVFMVSINLLNLFKLILKVIYCDLFTSGYEVRLLLFVDCFGVHMFC